MYRPHKYNSNKAKHANNRQTTNLDAGAREVGSSVSRLTASAAPAEALARWEAAATESARLLEEAQRRARTAEAEGGACAAREAVLRERV